MANICPNPAPVRETDVDDESDCHRRFVIEFAAAAKLFAIEVNALFAIEEPRELAPALAAEQVAGPKTAERRGLHMASPYDSAKAEK
jgi:hypothetical protein